MATITPTPVPAGLDPKAYVLTKAIALQENGGKIPNYNQASADDGSTPTGTSGKLGGGAYQFTSPTWANYAQKYLGSTNAPLTPENQNKVAYSFVSEQLAAGHTPAQIASMWNAGQGEPNAYTGTFSNGQSSANGVYNVPQYAKNVQKYAEQLWPTGASQDTTQLANAGTPTQTAAPTYGATFPATSQDNGLVAGFKALGNLPSSIYGFGQGIVNMIHHPIQTVENLGSAAIGGVENLTGQNAGGTPDQYQQTANALGSAFKDRYGGLSQLSNTATNDPFGFGSDVASVLAGGAGLVDRAGLAVGKDIGAADALSNAGSKVAQTATYPIRAVGSAVGSKLADATLAGVNPDVVAASNRTGVILPAGSYTDSSLINMGQALAATGAGEKATDSLIQTAVSKMNDVAANIVHSAGGSEDLTTAGQNIAQGLKDFEKAYKNANEANYGQVEKAVGDPVAQTAKPAELLQNIIDEKASIADSKNMRFFKDKLAVLTGGKTEGGLVADENGIENAVPKQYPAPTFSTIKRMKSNVGEMIDKKFAVPFVAENIKYLKQLYGALSQAELDTLRATGNARVVADYLAAKKAYVLGHAEIASQFGKTISRLAQNGQYDKIIDSLIKPSMSVNDIPRILNVVGDQGAAEIRTGFINKILEGAKDEHGDLKPGAILKQLQKYGDDKTAAILNPEQIQGLKDLGTLSEALGGVKKMAAGASSSFLVRQALQFRSLGETGGVFLGIGDLLSGNILGAVKKIGTVLGVEAASKFLASDTGQEFLRWGATHGEEFTAKAGSVGLHFDPPSSIIPNNELNSSVPGDVSGVGGDIPTDVGGTGVGTQETPSTQGKGLLRGALNKLTSPAIVPLEELANQRNFDLQGARDAGYTDQEIQSYLDSLATPNTP